MEILVAEKNQRKDIAIKDGTESTREKVWHLREGVVRLECKREGGSSWHFEK